MAWESLIFLVLVFTIFILVTILFNDNIFYHKLFAARNERITKSAKQLEKISERFKCTSLYKAILSSFDLEIQENTHYESIGDNFESFSELSNAIRSAGLESSNIVIGVDFTASNEWQGKNTFDHKNLHLISKKKLNPYQQVITSLSSTLEPFDGDNLIPAYGFGDEKTKDHSVFCFNPNGTLCKGFLNVLGSYEDIVDNVKMSGPTSFVPIIKKAIEITKTEQSYHILIIIADGQVEEKEDEATRNIIIEASNYPLSIIVVGVGDGPWDKMHTYDEKLPSRQFDNFQFVDYHLCCQKGGRSDINFALNALMEIPDQYIAIKRLGMIKETPAKKKCSSNSLDEQFMELPGSLSKKPVNNNVLRKVSSHSLLSLKKVN